MIETLRHTGVRLEELLEITHLALTSYQLPDTAELVPLQRLQHVFDHPDQVSAVLIANRDDTPAGAPLTGQVTSAVQSLLVNTAAATTIKLLLILPRGQDGARSRRSDAPFYLAALTRTGAIRQTRSSGVPLRHGGVVKIL